MYSVFLSSYRNTRESLGELEKTVETLTCASCSHSISRSPKLDRNTVHVFYFLKSALQVLYFNSFRINLWLIVTTWPILSSYVTTTMSCSFLKVPLRRNFFKFIAFSESLVVLTRLCKPFCPTSAGRSFFKRFFSRIFPPPLLNHVPATP